MNITMTPTEIELDDKGLPTVAAIHALPPGTEIRSASAGHLSAIRTRDLDGAPWLLDGGDGWDFRSPEGVAERLAEENLKPYRVTVPAAEPEREAAIASSAEPTPIDTALQWARLDAQQRHDLWSVRPLAELAEISSTMLDGQRSVYAEAQERRILAESIAKAREALREQLHRAHASEAVRNPEDEPEERLTVAERRRAGIGRIEQQRDFDL